MADRSEILDELNGLASHYMRVVRSAEDQARIMSDFVSDLAPYGIEAIRQRLTIERRVNNSQAVKVVSLVYPLAVHNVMTAALNEAAALGAPVVDADIVKALS